MASACKIISVSTATAEAPASEMRQPTNDPRPEDLVHWIEEQTEHKRQLQKRHDEHDGSDRDGRIEEPLCYGDEHARVNEPADALPFEQHEVVAQHSRGEKHNDNDNCRRAVSDEAAN